MVKNTEITEKQLAERETGQIAFPAIDEGRIRLMLTMETEDGGVPMLNIYYKKYIEPETKGGEGRYEDDETTFNEAMDTLHEIGVSEAASIDLKDKPAPKPDVLSTMLTPELLGKEVKVFYDPGNGSNIEPRASFKPIPKFIAYESIQGKAAAAIDDNDLLNKEIELNPVTEFKNDRFLFGLALDVDGEEKNLRATYLRYKGADGAPKKLTLKFSNKVTDQLKASMDNDKISETHREVMSKGFQTRLDQNRARKVAEIKEHIGIDVEELIESGDILKGKIKSIEPTEFNGETYYMLTLEIITPEEAE